MKIKNKQSGAALLMSLGILALLIVIGIAYATNIRLMENTTRNYVYEVQARYLAEGGIDYAISHLIGKAKNKFSFDLSDITPKGLPSYMLVTITGTASKININNANTNLLDCLPGIGPTSAGYIVSYRSSTASFPPGKFITKQSVCLVSGIGPAKYEDIKDMITTDVYVDPNVLDETGARGTTGRSAININTVDQSLLEDILEVVTDVGSTYASTVASALVGARPMNSWQSFNDLIDGLSISSDAKTNVKAVFNPNRTKIDANYPTEFCFHSGGYYDIKSVGNVSVTIGTTPYTVASKTINMTINISDYWNMSSKADFIGEDANYNGSLDSGEDINADGDLDTPQYARVTWMDSCPLDVDNCYTGFSYPTGGTTPETTSDALKIGYWDNFSDDTTYSTNMWQTLIAPPASPTIVGGELMEGETWGCDSWSILSLGPLDGTSHWIWEYYSVRAYLRNTDHTIDFHYYPWPPTTSKLRFYDVGAHLLLTSINSATRQHDVYISEADPFSDPYHTDEIKLIHEIDYWDPTPDHEYTYPPDPRLWITNAYDYPPAFYTVMTSYWPEKTFHVVLTGSGGTDAISVDAYDPTGATVAYGRSGFAHSNFGGIGGATGIEQGEGAFLVYACNSDAYLDNVRIISQTGYYQSVSLPTPTGSKVGMIYGTETIPSTASSSSEKIAFQVSADGTNWYPNVDQFTAIDSQLQPEGGSMYNALRTGGVSTSSSQIYYRANLFTSDTDYSETPVLEDVWMTYIPKTKILYWKEGE